MMSLRIVVVVLAVLTGVTGSPTVKVRPEADLVDVTAHPNSVPEVEEENEITGQEVLVDEEIEEVMMTGELNPNHYPARRAAQVVQHYLNTRHGSPYRLFSTHEVHSGNAEDVDSGRKYQLEISVRERISNATEKCSAEVLFPKGEPQRSPEVQASCGDLLTNNSKAQEEEALYQKYKGSQTPVSAEHLPDSHGHIEPGMEPFWHLCTVASSFVMLNKSTENTVYNMAQVANITQLASENDQLKFDCHTLLHDMVSQEIIPWKLLFTWSPPEGVKVLQMEQLPHCHECEKPPNTN